VGVAKGTVFLHFASKEGLFLAAFQRSVRELPAWLDVPDEIKDRGFWNVLDHWLERTEAFVAEVWVQNRVAMIGRYDTGLRLRRPIDRFMRSEDPYGTLEFVEFGVRRGEIRDDVDVDMIASMLDWLAERFQDALASEELDPGLVHRKPYLPERRATRIREFLELVRTGLAAR
jgi:AcrR family transcriptional regulator